jgi:hypothetical protein
MVAGRVCFGHQAWSSLNVWADGRVVGDAWSVGTFRMQKEEGESLSLRAPRVGRACRVKNGTQCSIENQQSQMFVFPAPQELIPMNQ